MDKRSWVLHYNHRVAVLESLLVRVAEEHREATEVYK